MNRRAIALVAFVLLAALSCRGSSPPRPYREAPSTEFASVVLDYADTEAFDTLLESSLVNQDPIIVIRTAHQKPDWTGRLNAWIAAWNQGGKVEGRTARGQAAPVTVNGETIREVRLLVNSLMDRVEELAKAGAGWWSESRTRTRRVALLRPYNLRFHMADDGTIHLIFFNGKAAESYADFVRLLTDADPPASWERTVEYSSCKTLREKSPIGLATYTTSKSTRN